MMKDYNRKLWRQYWACTRVRPRRVNGRMTSRKSRERPVVCQRWFARQLSKPLQRSIFTMEALEDLYEVHRL